MNIIKGDLLSVTEGVIAHGCNCSGGFGSGVAGQIARKYPSVRNAFMALPPCKELLGTTQYVKVADSLFIANCFTQKKYGSSGGPYASLEAIHTSVLDALLFCYRNGLNTLSLPWIGSGLGGLSKEEVREVYGEVDWGASIVKVALNVYELGDDLD